MTFVYLFAFNFHDGFGTGCGRCFIHTDTPLGSQKRVEEAEKQLSTLVKTILEGRTGERHRQRVEIMANSVTYLESKDRAVPDGEEMIFRSIVVHYITAF